MKHSDACKLQNVVGPHTIGLFPFIRAHGCNLSRSLCPVEALCRSQTTLFFPVQFVAEIDPICAFPSTQVVNLGVAFLYARSMVLDAVSRPMWPEGYNNP